VHRKLKDDDGDDLPTNCSGHWEPDKLRLRFSTYRMVHKVNPYRNTNKSGVMIAIRVDCFRQIKESKTNYNIITWR